MTHPDIEAQVDAYLDGELAAIDAAELEAHLAGCASCGRFRDDRLALRAAIAAQFPRLRGPGCAASAGARRARDSVVHRSHPPARHRPGAGWRSPRRSRSSRSAAGGSRSSTPRRRS